MKKIVSTALILAACLAVAGSAAAQGRPRRAGDRAQRLFNAMDKNKDGAISRDEWRRRPALFSRFDVNRDGVLTHDEFQRIARRLAVRRARAARRR
jgi:Ca2+-binding EF-hand superfamily protein